MPPEFQPNEPGVEYAIARGVGRKQLAKFINHHTAKGSLMADWDAAWKNWCDKAVELGQAPGHPLPAAPGPKVSVLSSSL